MVQFSGVFEIFGPYSQVKKTRKALKKQAKSDGIPIRFEPMMTTNILVGEPNDTYIVATGDDALHHKKMSPEWEGYRLHIAARRDLTFNTTNKKFYFRDLPGDTAWSISKLIDKLKVKVGKITIKDEWRNTTAFNIEEMESLYAKPILEWGNYKASYPSFKAFIDKVNDTLKTDELLPALEEGRFNLLNGEIH